MNHPVALVTGVAGQDGSYLTELLLAKGYLVHGIARRRHAVANIEHIVCNSMISGKSFFLHFADLVETKTVRNIVREAHPEEIYHLAAQSRARLSFAEPGLTHVQVADVTKALLELAYAEVPEAKFFHASSAEVFGGATETPQNENTPFRPVTPYGEAKAIATEEARYFRERKGFFVCNGILYNHESPRRGTDFVTQKIAHAAARIVRGLQKDLKLGNLASRRDWGRAQDYVAAMWMMLQHGAPDDYIVATGQTHSVREFADSAFSLVGLDWEKFVKSEAALTRPADPQLVGCPDKIRSILGWQATATFEQLVREMVEAELRSIDSVTAS